MFVVLWGVYISFGLCKCRVYSLATVWEEEEEKSDVTTYEVTNLRVVNDG